MPETNDYLPYLMYTGEQVGALDARFTSQFEVSGQTLMERAARAAYAELSARWPMPGRMLVLCGPGNNGGDGALMALLARSNGWNVRLVSPVPLDKASGEAARAFTAYREDNGEIGEFVDEPIEQVDLIVDALLGTGVNRDVEGPIAAAIARINEARDNGVGVLSIDLPSGLDAGTGRRCGDAVKADLTVCFIGLKLGLMTGDGPVHAGELAFDNLGAPETLYDEAPHVARRITHRDLRYALPARANSAHKGDNGHVLCVGGDRGMGGAIRLTAEAALRAGAGLTSVICHLDHAGAMSQARPELMCLAHTEDEGVQAQGKRMLDAATVIAIGPGLGKSDWGKRLFDDVMARSDTPLVVDADALNRLSTNHVSRQNWILTPHPGEAARLLGIDTEEVLADRIAAVRQLSDRYEAIVVLKGAGSLIATADETWVCTQGNPGMAVGGMGDVLTGIIAAFVSQGLSLEEAAVFGTYVHALAGDATAEAIGERGMLPTDLIARLPEQINTASR